MKLPKAFFLLCITAIGFLQLATDQVNAEVRIQTEGNTKVTIKSSQNFSSTSNNSSTTTNRIQINGQEVLNETDQNDSSNSHSSSVDVNLENGQGTVKYKINGEEKTVQVTPKDGKTDVTVDGNSMEVVNDTTDKKAEAKKEELEKQIDAQGEENKSFIERITESIKNFFASLFS